MASASVGAGTAFFALVRPNTSAAVLLVAALVYSLGPKGRWRRILALVAGTALGVGSLATAARLSALPLNPLAIKPSMTLLYATADYFWPPEVGAWPNGSSPEDTARLQREKARQRWRQFLSAGGPDRIRSLIWRLTHPLLSAEQFPSRWDQPAYAASSKFIRRWWWLIMSVAAAASAACAVAGKGAWRLAPLAVFLIAMAQGIVFGAETRFALPLIPIAAIGLIVTLPTVRPSPAAVTVSLVTFLALFGATLKVPESVASDYASRGRCHSTAPGRQALSQRRQGDGPCSDTRFSHHGTRLANGDLVYRRLPEETAPHPAYLSFVLGADALRSARQAGLELEIRFTTDPSGQTILSYPVVPSVFGASSTIQGTRLLPSAFGGVTTGGFPVWTHPGEDQPVPLSSN